MNFNLIKEINVTIENYLEKNYEDDNCDVIVTFKNGDRYISSFFTFRNIETLRKNFSTNGECMNGKYFWSSDMFIIDNLKPENVKSVIKYLIDNKEFTSIFKKLELNSVSSNESSDNFVDPLDQI